ncbi:hydrolase [Rubrivivax gelatinosus]|uniref:NUDIX hydrolase n=1 Tax=Rubrivivax gelatinosus TaxID=28068 RepID=UPI001902D64F|nr:NUDIX domain-containing protein [Rubrivivax gelatinosus]MBK1614410.1 hydrolase [Rubrivivax gelatinosus]
MTSASFPTLLAQIDRARRVDALRHGALLDRCGPIGAAHCSRSSFPWHLTASVFVVDAAHRRTLLIEHPTLGRLLQPGGHLEAGEHLLQAALRELHEECGIAATALLALDEQPFDIDLHAIPASERRGEPAHQHLDFCFVATATDDAGPGGELATRWLPLDDARVHQQPRLARLAARLAAAPPLSLDQGLRYRGG